MRVVKGRVAGNTVVLDATLPEISGEASTSKLDNETVQEVLAAAQEADAGGEFVTSEELWASIRERPRK